MPDPANFKVTLDRAAELAASLRKLADTSVMVGIPADDEKTVGTGSEKRQGNSPIGNAVIGYISEHGSPAQGIPPRPWLRPSVASSKDKWSEYLRQAGQLALEGKSSAVTRALNACGITAVSAIKNYIVAGIPPPLKPATIQARRQRSKGSSYLRKATTASDTTPLVDTAQFLNAISYIIRRKRS